MWASRIISECEKIRLSLNTAKCEDYFCSAIDQHKVSQLNEITPEFQIFSELTLLVDDTFDEVFNKILNEMQMEMEMEIQLKL